MQQLSKFSLLFALLALLPLTARAQADDPSAELQTEARTRTESVADSTYRWIALITGAILLMGLTQAVSRNNDGTRAARKLFLGVRLRPYRAGDGGTESGDGEQIAWIRALDTHAAVLVSSQALAKGARVHVHLAPLPDYPISDECEWLDAEVRQVRLLGGDPSSYEIRLHFPRMKQTMRTFLATYVQRLAAHGGLQHV